MDPASRSADIHVPAAPPARPRVVAGSRWFHLLATLTFLGLVIATALTRSISPAILGRYSAPWFAYQLLNLTALGLLCVPTRWAMWRRAGYLLIIVSTFLATSNETVSHRTATLPALAAVRLLAGLAMIAFEFDRFREDRRSARGAVLGAGLALVALAGLDLALWTWVRPSLHLDEDHEGFRDAYALGSVTPDDVVLVGDSFVWGLGVPKSRRFGDVLERLYVDEGRRVRVYSLGVRGAGPDRDIESLSRVPEGRDVGAILLSFYPNDLAPRPRRLDGLRGRIRGATWALAQSSLTLRAFHDVLGRWENPSLAAYHQSVIDDYRRSDPTFPRRWAKLTADLGEFARRSRRRSPARPCLLIIPLMVDYSTYPLASAHEELRRTAERLGYDVLDLLPPFREALGDGSRYRVDPDDNHFDARVHELTARLIKRHLDGRAETSSLGQNRGPGPSLPHPALSRP